MANFFREIYIVKTKNVMKDEAIMSIVEAITDINESQLKQAASFVELEKNIGWIKKGLTFYSQAYGAM